jgi:hypothetical protein
VIAVATLAVAIVCGLGPASRSQATPVGAQPLAKQRVKLVFFKGRVRSDGIVTPGEPETVAVSHMPPRARFKMAIEPPPTTPQCGEFYFCDFAPVSPAPGSAPFRTSGKGRALVTFVMPTTYNIATDPFDPSARRPVSFANGQSVHIDVDGVKRLHRVRKIGFGFGRAIVKTSS